MIYISCVTIIYCRTNNASSRDARHGYIVTHVLLINCTYPRFPKKSGNWYTGKHEPLITKELFDLVQEQIGRQMVWSKSVEAKEFAFTKLMSCGLCGSGITADEKFKKLNDGSTNRHVYYKCTRSRDKERERG